MMGVRSNGTDGTDKSDFMQHDGQGVYLGLSAASERFLFFTTQLCSYLCNYNAILFSFWQEGKYCNRNTPTPNTTLSLLLVASKMLKSTKVTECCY